MKTFKDLVFGPHPTGPGLQAKIFFDNGYGVSVVRFKTIFHNRYGSYTSNESEWEIAFLRGQPENWKIVFHEPFPDGVEGHLDEKRVTECMELIQKLPRFVE